MQPGDYIEIAVIIISLAIGFIGQTIYFRGSFSEKLIAQRERVVKLEKSVSLKADKESVIEIKEELGKKTDDKEFTILRAGVQFVDTCKANYTGLKDRVGALERIRNGRKEDDN